MLSSLSPTITPTALPTDVPKGAAGDIPPSGAPPSVFQPPGSFANEEGGAGETNDDPNDLAMIVAVALSGTLLLAILLLAGTRYRNRETKEEVIELDSDAEYDLEAPAKELKSETPSETITSTSDSIEVEVMGGAPVFSPKQKKKSRKKKKKKALSPSTPQTLESIEELPEEPSDNTSLVLLDDDVAVDLNERFQFIAEVQTFEENSDDDSYVETGSVGQSRDGTHLELSVGNNNLKPVESAESKNIRSGTPPPSSRQTTLNKSAGKGRSTAYAEEEKKEGDRSPTLSPTPMATSQISPRVAMEMSPSSHLSPLSTGSSVYLSDSEERTEQAGPVYLSPNLSPHILSGALDDDVPDDEAKAMGSTRARLMMQQPSLSHKHNARSRSEEAEAPDDELAAPGSHYMPKPSSTGKKINRPRPPSSPAKGKYGQSVRSRNFSGFAALNTSSDSDSVSSQEFARPQNQRPSFKRRSKREEKPEPVKQEDTWGSFLNDLAAAEEAFFSPTATQKSSILKYDESSIDSDGNDDWDMPMA